MAYREVSRMEIRELIRRWQDGQSGRRISSSIGMSRNTVAKCRFTGSLTQGFTESLTHPGSVVF